MVSVLIEEQKSLYKRKVGKRRCLNFNADQSTNSKYEDRESMHESRKFK